jgi:predicted enzyme related to lactoylglutathione lyase
MNKIFSYVAIPAEDFERAFNFYHKITGGLIYKNPKVPFPMAYFTDQENRDVGHLFKLPNFKPSENGPIVYMEIAKDLNETLEKIGNAGGIIKMPKTLISREKGYWALFMDTEGNQLALHSGE